MIEYQTTIEKCKGCRSEAIVVDPRAPSIRLRFCMAYINPKAKWEGGRCNHTSIPSPEQEKQMATRKVNPLKASKRAMRMQKGVTK